MLWGLLLDKNHISTVDNCCYPCVVSGHRSVHLTLVCLYWSALATALHGSNTASQVIKSKYVHAFIAWCYRTEILALVSPLSVLSSSIVLSTSESTRCNNQTCLTAFVWKANFVGCNNNKLRLLFCWFSYYNWDALHKIQYICDNANLPGYLLQHQIKHRLPQWTDNALRHCTLNLACIPVRWPDMLLAPSKQKPWSMGKFRHINKKLARFISGYKKFVVCFFMEWSNTIRNVSAIKGFN